MRFLSLILPFVSILLLSFGIYGSFLFTFSIPFFWQIGVKNQGFKSLGIKREKFVSSLFLGIVSGILLSMLGIFILKVLGIRNISLEEKYIFGISLRREIGGYLLVKKSKILFLFYCLFSVGLGEELFWRGFIQQKLKNYFKENFAIFFTAGLFSLVHLYFFWIVPFLEAILLLFSVFILGIIWGIFFEKFKNVVFPALSHGLIAFFIWSYLYR